jgi:hypothetical protein
MEISPKGVKCDGKQSGAHVRSFILSHASSMSLLKFFQKYIPDVT